MTEFWGFGEVLRRAHDYSFAPLLIISGASRERLWISRNLFPMQQLHKTGLAGWMKWPLVQQAQSCAPKFTRACQQLPRVGTSAASLKRRFFWQDFSLAIIGYFPSLLLLGAAFVVQINMQRKPSALLGCIGVGTMLVAVLVQQLRVAISARYFDHNALYHVLQAAALYLLYIAVRPAIA